jgi:hypothetical protein
MCTTYYGLLPIVKRVAPIIPQHYMCIYLLQAVQKDSTAGFFLTVCLCTDMGYNFNTFYMLNTNTIVLALLVHFDFPWVALAQLKFFSKKMDDA